MNRQALTDSNGWFDKDNAIQFDEDTRWDGNNHISVPTGNQWAHQALFLTRSKAWVLHSWSAYQGTTDTFDLIPSEEAVDWLVQNCLDDDLSELPKDIREEVEAGIAQAEV